MLYSQKDLDEITALLKRFYKKMALYLAAPLAMVIAALIFRIDVLGYIGAVALGVIATVGWFAVGNDVNRYRKLVRDILTSPERTAEGTLTEILPEREHRDGAAFVPVRLQVTDKERGESYVRNLIFDDLKGEFPAEVGSRIKVRLFDNVIKEVEIIE